MRKALKKIKVLALCNFKNWVRYPENFGGLLLYIGLVMFVGWYLQMLTGDASEEVFGISPVLYYASGLFVFLLIGNQNSALMAFSAWRMDILSKQLSPDIFLLGNYLGQLLTDSLPGIFLLFFSLIMSPPSLNLYEIFMLISLLIVFFSASVGVSYFFGAMGLRMRPIGFVFTSIMMLITIFCGIMIPIQAIPQGLRWISYSIPYTWSIDGFRALVLNSRPLMPVEREIFLLLVLSIFLIVVGRLTLYRMIQRIKERKVIIR